MTRTLSRAERIAWARLAHTPRVGPLTFHRLIAKYRTASAALKALPRFSDSTPPSADKIEAELDGLERINARLLASSEPDYPTLLAQLDAPPPLLALRGDAKWLKQPVRHCRIHLPVAFRPDIRPWLLNKALTLTRS